MIAPKEHAALILLLAQHEPINCGTCGTTISPSLGKLDQAGIPLDAAVYECTSGNCEWKRTVKLILDVSKESVSVAIETPL